jgi:prepilin-type N-terminal cleavage/methylation domain-containing protein
LGQAIKGLDGAAINIEHAAGEELLVKLKIMQRVKGVTLIELIVSIAILAIVVIAFSGMFVNGFKSIIKSGNRSSSDYGIQQVIENKILNPVSGTENNVTTEVTVLADGLSINFGTNEIDVPGKIVKSEYNDGKSRAVFTTFVPDRGGFTP